MYSLVLSPGPQEIRAMDVQVWGLQNLRERLSHLLRPSTRQQDQGSVLEQMCPRGCILGVGEHNSDVLALELHVEATCSFGGTVLLPSALPLLNPDHNCHV